MFTAAKLVDGDTELVFVPDVGLGAVNIQVGLPSARVVAQDRTDGDGSRDTTSLFGPRVVSVGFRALQMGSDTAAVLQDQLNWFLHPARRPYLVFTMDGQVERRLRLRPDSGSMAFTPDRFMMVDTVAQWVAPDGAIEATVLSSEVLTATADDEAGREYDLTFDRAYPASNPVGAAEVTNDGNVVVYPLIRLYGPCDDPQVENQTTGEVFALAGVSVAAGDYLEVDMRERTVRLNGLVAQSRLQYVDFAGSVWWALRPGANWCRFFPVSSSAGSEAQILFRSAWL